MNFLGVGPAELIVILVVALVFVGPERLPRLAADIARTIREIRKYTGSLAAEFNEVIQDFEKDTEGERTAWKEIETGITGATNSVTDAVRDAKSEVRGATTDPEPTIPQTGDSAATETTWAEIPSEPPASPAEPSPATNGASSAANHAGLPTQPERSP